MQTFRLFMKLVKRNIPSVIMYFVIFLVIAIMAGTNGEGGMDKIYQDESIPFTVLNRDNSSLGEAIKEYLSRNNEYIEEEDDLEKLQDDMYYRIIYYVLVIPEGFEQSLREGREIPLTNYKVEGSAMGYYMDLSVEAYLAALRACLAAGFPFEEAMGRAGSAMEAEASITVRQVTGEVQGEVYNYYQFLPYIFLSMLINALGSILVAFNRETIRRRMACSALDFSKRGLQIALGTGVFGLAVWLVFEIMAVILYQDGASVFTYVAAGMNSLCFVLLTVALSVMCGLMAKKTVILSAISIILSLGFSFLGGVFVPLAVLGGGILKIAKFIPTYWYVTANDAIVKAEGFSSAAFRPAWTGMGVQLLFAAAFFSAAIVASKRQNGSRPYPRGNRE